MDILVLAKEPRPGRVKTRLCPPCTPAEAAAIAEASLADTLAAAGATGADRVVLALDGRPGRWCPPGTVVVPQGTGDLPARLATAWRATRGPALQIGMDTPQVRPDQLEAAMARLDASGVDAVFGPAVDGGWWAIGLQAPVPGIFAGVATSRADTGARQRARLLALGLTVADLEKVRDVDTWADAVAVADAAPGGTFAAAVGAVAAGVTA